MKFLKVRVSTFDKEGNVVQGVTKLRWELNTKEGRFTAPDWMTPEQLESALKNGSFKPTEFQTGDGRTVYTILAREIVEQFDTKDNRIVISKAGSAEQLESAEITYLE